MARPLKEVLQDPEVLADIHQHPHTFRFCRGASLLVTSTHWPPHNYFVLGSADGTKGEDDGGHKETGSLVAIEGPMANVLSVLAHTLNFTYKLITPSDNLWGGQLPNGSWTGMLGQVIKKEVDLALGPFSVTLERTKVVGLTTGVMIDDRCLLAAKGATEVNPWSFLMVLMPSVWVCLAATLLLVWGTHMLLVFVIKRPVDWKLMVEIYFRLLRTLFNQNVNWRSVTSLERVLMGVWLLGGLVMTWCYSSNLTSLLAVRRIPQSIQTLRTLIDDPSLTLILTPNTIITTALAHSQEGELKEVHRLDSAGRTVYVQINDFPRTLDTLVKQDDHVLLGTTSVMATLIAQSFSQTGECSFYLSRQKVISNIHSMVVQQGSPILPAISYRVRQMIEAGLYTHWVETRLRNYTRCRKSPSSITVRTSIALTGIWGMVVVLYAGLVAATATFFVELVIARIYPAAQT
ncbi:hypothetical protein Pcinc_030018 [Petrolisthes cinctipes]|uniref:Ionotropic glutamate receptor L-glutamate and glycine-binding domain-containing protein n=1 Tax=Petrolisthes cinctipes TaxID=88211 RepID=A0AAE1EZM6_PETCI|nr:hypothetical protein Pcinc_030018 [Petrolisthes cinctipes]